MPKLLLCYEVLCQIITRKHHIHKKKKKLFYTSNLHHRPIVYIKILTKIDFV